MAIALKRVYETPSRTDGLRILVDRLWPRGLTKEAAAIDEWLRALAPSHELRRWFHARPEQWPSFRKKYLKELHDPAAATALGHLYQILHRRKRVTLLFASKNVDRNNATVLKELLEGMRKPPTGTGPGAIGIASKRQAAVRRR